MPRKARVVFPNIPHHITQRGNRRQRIFFDEDDYAFYLTRIGEFAARYQVSILAYCLMTNHVHHILVPSTPDGLHKMLKAGHSAELISDLIGLATYGRLDFSLVRSMRTIC